MSITASAKQGSVAGEVQDIIDMISGQSKDKRESALLSALHGMRDRHGESFERSFIKRRLLLEYIPDTVDTITALKQECKYLTARANTQATALTHLTAVIGLANSTLSDNLLRGALAGLMDMGRLDDIIALAKNAIQPNTDILLERRVQRQRFLLQVVGLDATNGMLLMCAIQSPKPDGNDRIKIFISQTERLEGGNQQGRYQGAVFKDIERPLKVLSDITVISPDGKRIAREALHQFKAILPFRDLPHI
jgi:hypothetical protein